MPRWATRSGPRWPPSTTPGVAVLDINLGQGTSAPVAGELERRGVPFVFATGYGEAADLPGHFRAAPVVRKPYTAAALVEAISRAVAKAG